MRISLLLSLQLLTGVCLFGQATVPEYVYVDSISIAGNYKTRDFVILREMSIREGDTILVDELSGRIAQSEQMIMNTGLFNRAGISFKAWEGETNRVELLVTVEETWFLYPIPIFELADRNFNVWWVEQNRSLKRTNYGMDFAHINVTGRNDRLKAAVKYGYTRRYELAYNIPYINEAKTLGFSVMTDYIRNREVNYQTRDNKQEFFEQEDDFVYARFRTQLGLVYRPAVKSFHRFTLGFQQTQVGEEIAKLHNPEFFLGGRRSMRFASFRYEFLQEGRDVAAYPWEGYYLSGELLKEGLGLFGERDGMTIRAGAGRYLPLNRRWSMALEARGKLSLIRTQQPYRENRALGFGADRIRGYEYYIIDGLDMGLLKSSLRFRFLDKALNFGKLMPIDAFKRMPFRLHLSFNSDFGYVNAPHASPELNNFLNNRALWGGGIGLDIVLYYNKVIQIEYSYNDLLESGLFLHLSMNL